MDSSVTESRGTKSSNRPFVGGAFVLLAINTFLTWLRTPAGRGSAYVIGVVFGSALIFTVVGLLVYGIARAFGKAKTGAGRARIAFWTMGALLIPNLTTLVALGSYLTQAAADTSVTDAERRGLQVDSDSIRHVGLGFVLPHPGSGFSASPELQAKLDKGLSDQPGMAAWAFRDTALGQALVIQVAKLGPVNERRFREYAAGMREGVTKSKVLESTLNWRDPIGEYRLTLLHPAGAYITMRCVARVQRSAIVCVQTTAAQPNAMETSRAGLRVTM